MSVTISDIQTILNSAIGDTSTDRITAAERLSALSEGTIWVQEELANDLQNYTYSLKYFDTINYYKVTADIADLLLGKSGLDPYLEDKESIHIVSPWLL